MRIALYGPPGVGKGTQAALLVERHGLTHISTGSLIRAAIEAKEPVGLEAKPYIEAGKLAPDPLVRKLAEGAVAKSGYDDFILDGYPRNVVQAEWLEGFLKKHRAPLHAVISLEVPEENVVRRLSQRRVHKVTGESYHLEFNPPPSDVDPKLIVHREDDRAEAILERLRNYRAQTQPVQAFYRERGLFYEVDGVGEIEEVHARIEALLKQVTLAEDSA